MSILMRNETFRLPSITFRVANIDFPKIVSQLPPDGNLDNIILQLKAQTVWIPYVPYPLKFGDEFTLHEMQAIETYNNFIGKEPKILEVVTTDSP
jgi:hypothetical protein